MEDEVTKLEEEVHLHEHGEACCCGHDHDHHHEHGENCGCGHDHDHHHEHGRTVDADMTTIITTSTGEPADADTTITIIMTRMKCLPAGELRRPEHMEEMRLTES